LRGALNLTSQEDLLSNTRAEQTDERLLNFVEATGHGASRSCCAKCPNFCSPRSGLCHESPMKPHYEQCHGSAPLNGSNGSQPLNGSVPPTGGRIMTLYHTTSLAAAKKIVAGNFRRGRSGWCGPGIYFTPSPGLKRSKMNPRTTKTGAIIQAKVRMGKICSIKRPPCKTHGGYGTKGAAKVGCGSIRFNPGDGDEYIIWNAAQVMSKKILCTPCRNGGLKVR